MCESCSTNCGNGVAAEVRTEQHLPGSLLNVYIRLYTLKPRPSKDLRGGIGRGAGRNGRDAERGGEYPGDIHSSNGRKGGRCPQVSKLHTCLRIALELEAQGGALRPALIALQEISQPSFSVSSLTAGSMIHRRRSLKFVVWLVFASMAVAKASTETCFQPVSLYCINISKSRHE